MAAAGVLVGTFGVRWTTLGLGVVVAGCAAGLLVADLRDGGRRVGIAPRTPGSAGEHRSTARC